MPRSAVSAVNARNTLESALAVSVILFVFYL